MSLIKTDKQLAAIREAGCYLFEIFEVVKSMIEPNVTTLSLDNLISQEIKKRGCRSSFLSYEGYPYSSCVSVNHQVIHAFPGEYALQKGDIVTVDIGLWHDSVCVDAARTYFLPPISKQAQRLIDLTNQALAAGISQAKVNNRVGQISAAISAVAEEAELGIVRSYTGHGVGTAVHEDPAIPNVGVPTDGPILRAGMVIAIEPMFTLGSGDVLTESDGWTVISADLSLAAQSEDTVIITDKGPEIVTNILHND